MLKSVRSVLSSNAWLLSSLILILLYSERMAFHLDTKNLSSTRQFSLGWLCDKLIVEYMYTLYKDVLHNYLFIASTLMWPDCFYLRDGFCTWGWNRI